MNAEGAVTVDVPAWFREVPEAQRGSGVQAEAGGCWLQFCDRGRDQLIVSFGNASEVDHPELDWPGWTDRLARAEVWSHLAITGPDRAWFRDPGLLAYLEELRDAGFFAGFARVAFLGASHAGGGFAALALSALCPGAVVIAFSPQSTLDANRVPWETRFAEGQARDWTLPFGDAAETLATADRAYVVFDAFRAEDKAHVDRLPAAKTVALKGFGLEQDTAVALRRLGHLAEFVKGAVAGTLTAEAFYEMARGRRDLYIYRRNLEAHLDARGKTRLQEQFTRAFRRRARQRRAEKNRQTKPAPKPTPPLPPKRSRKAGAVRRPRALGNAWMVQDEGDRLRYMSDQYQGRVMGYEEREGVTLAETPPVALAMASLGGAGLERPLPERFEYHVVDEQLDGWMPSFAAKSVGVAAQRLAGAGGRAYRTVVALTEPQAGITAAEALPDGARYRELIDRIDRARMAMEHWGKQLCLDRIGLRLLEGAPETPFQDAADHYAAVARALRQDAAVAAGQASQPLIVVSQGAGGRRDGGSEVILAEGQLDILHPALGFVVATPSYPFGFLAGTAATHAPEARMLIDELEARAVAELLENRRWYCPSLRQAYLRDRTLVAEFTALCDLVLDDGPHGFALIGCDNDPEITAVRVSGTTAYLTLNKAPKGHDMALTYAWGFEDPKNRTDRAANQGALRDSWSADSVMAPGRTLHRHALSGRVRLMPSDLPAEAPT